MADTDCTERPSRDAASRLNPFISASPTDTMDRVADALEFLSFNQTLPGVNLPDSADTGRIMFLEVIKYALRYEVSGGANNG